MNRLALLALSVLFIFPACGESSDPACPDPDTDIVLPQDEAPHMLPVMVPANNRIEPT